MSIGAGIKSAAVPAVSFGIQPQYIPTPGVGPGFLRGGSPFFDGITDFFDRRDDPTTMGKTSTGDKVWADAAGSWGINQRRAYQSGSGDGWRATTIDIGTINSTVECDITLSSVRASAGICVRVPNGNTSYGTLVRIRRIATGNASVEVYNPTPGYTLVVSNPSLVLGGTYRLKAVTSGNDLAVFVDGVFVGVGSAAVSNSPGNTRVGLFQWFGASDDDGGSRYNNFSVRV